MDSLCLSSLNRQQTCLSVLGSSWHSENALQRRSPSRRKVEEATRKPSGAGLEQTRYQSLKLAPAPLDTQPLSSICCLEDKIPSTLSSPAVNIVTRLSIAVN